MKALRVSPQVDPEVDSAKQENKLLVAGLLTIKKAGGGGDIHCDSQTRNSQSLAEKGGIRIVQK